MAMHVCSMIHNKAPAFPCRFLNLKIGGRRQVDDRARYWLAARITRGRLNRLASISRKQFHLRFHWTEWGEALAMDCAGTPLLDGGIMLRRRITLVFSETVTGKGFIKL